MYPKNHIVLEMMIICNNSKKRLRIKIALLVICQPRFIEMDGHY